MRGIGVNKSRSPKVQYSGGNRLSCIENPRRTRSQSESRSSVGMDTWSMDPSFISSGFGGSQLCWGENTPRLEGLISYRMSKVVDTW